MKRIRFLPLMVKAIRFFSVLCMGMMLAMLIEFGLEAWFIATGALSVVLYAITHIVQRVLFPSETEESEYDGEMERSEF